MREQSSLASRRMRRSRYGFRVLVIALMVCVCASAPSSAAQPVRDGLGGYPSFTEETTVDLAQGQQVGPINSLWVENTGSESADVAFSSTAPGGIAIRPERTTATLGPGQSQYFRFSIAVSEGQTVGTYRVGVFVTQQNPHRSDEHPIKYAPQVGAHFNLHIAGATASATVTPINAQDRSPVSGDLSITYVSRPESTFTVATGKGSQLSSRLAPGAYVAKFSVPGVTEKSVPFSVRDGERKVVEIPVNTVSFIFNGLTENREGDALATVQLAAGVKNSLKAMPGPVWFTVQVTRDEQPLDTVTFGNANELPVGTTEANTIYRPTNGWEPGSYVFSYRLVTPTFQITADETRSIAIAGPSRLLPIAGLATLTVLVALALMAWHRRRSTRRRGKFAVEIVSTGEHPGDVVGELRVLTGLSREDIEALLASLPATVISGVQEDAANDVVRQLAELGATARVTDSAA